MMSSKCAALELTHPANLGFSYKDATLWLEGYVRKKSLSFELKPIFDDDVKSISLYISAIKKMNGRNISASKNAMRNS